MTLKRVVKKINKKIDEIHKAFKRHAKHDDIAAASECEEAIEALDWVLLLLGKVKP